jgi:hypothetical protein
MEEIMSENLFGFEIEKKWDYENAFYITSNSKRIAKILAHYELYKSIIDLPGQIVECGVFKGISLIRYAAFREILENTYSRKIIGFDAFGNFPQETSKKDKSFPEHHDSIAGKGIDIDELYKVFQYKNNENIELVKGDIINTVPEYSSEHPELKIALLHIDVDIYEPTEIILKYLYDRVVKGGLVVFDDYALIDGETKAIDEYFQKHDVLFKKNTFLEKPTYIRK